MEADLQSRIDGQIALLEKVSNMSEKDAHDELMQVVENKMQGEIAAYIHEQEEDAKTKAREKSRLKEEERNNPTTDTPETTPQFTEELEDNDLEATIE